MNRYLLLFVFSASILVAKAQNNIGTIRTGICYAHDFPGLNGYSFHGEFLKPFNERLEFGMGLRYTNMNGFPRTTTVNEFTRSANLDLHLYFLPVHTEQHALRLGGGYSFSFYSIQRAYPIFSHEAEPGLNWQSSQQKGKNKWFSVVGEYEYFIPNTNISAGLRASFFKAYDGVSALGLFAAVAL